MFLLADRLNYSSAAQECRNRSGRLGDVMSEARTEALAQLLVGAGMEAAFVDGKSENGSEFYNVNGKGKRVGYIFLWYGQIKGVAGNLTPSHSNKLLRGVRFLCPLLCTL